FSQVPIKDILNIIKASHEVPSDFIPLIEHCLTTTYFSYNNQFYEQTSGAAMELIIPYRNYGNLTEEQECFNFKFSACREVKCCVLHNMCISNADNIENIKEMNLENVAHMEEFQNIQEIDRNNDRIADEEKRNLLCQLMQ
ncbi:hypothetical protein ALC60_01853, partial [Trachymyrmex zeteki]